MRVMRMDRDITMRKAELRIPRRLPESNKGSYGRVLILAGSEGMCGAAYLSALAAYRCGAGLVRIISSESNRSVLQTLLPEAVLRLYKEDLLSFMEQECSWADFCVAGPGIGKSDTARMLLKGMLKSGKAPLLLDADGLNILSENSALFALFKSYGEKYPTVVTPHPMEMSRLLGKPVSEILENPEDAAKEFSRRANCITVMKGSESLVIREMGVDELTDSPANFYTSGMVRGKMEEYLLRSGEDERFGYIRTEVRESEFWELEEKQSVFQKAEDKVLGFGDNSGCLEKQNRERRRDIYRNCKPSPPLSKAGSGDVLSGCIAGIYEILKAEEVHQGNFRTDKQSLSELLYRASSLGVTIHAEAGRLAGEELGEHSVLARDTANHLGKAIESCMDES